jgi:UDP-N-acetylglucosamine 3-dehydrogenase
MTRVAVIGVGSMGRNHARVYYELPEAELVSVSDTNSASAASIGSQFGAKAYTSLGNKGLNGSSSHSKKN